MVNPNCLGSVIHIAAQAKRTIINYYGDQPRGRIRNTKYEILFYIYLYTSTIQIFESI